MTFNKLTESSEPFIRKHPAIGVVLLSLLLTLSIFHIFQVTSALCTSIRYANGNIVTDQIKHCIKYARIWVFPYPYLPV